MEAITQVSVLGTLIVRSKGLFVHLKCFFFFYNCYACSFFNASSTIGDFKFHSVAYNYKVTFYTVTSLFVILQCMNYR